MPATRKRSAAAIGSDSKRTKTARGSKGTSSVASGSDNVWTIVGKLSESKAKVTARLKALGWSTAGSITKAVTHVLVGENEIEKPTAKTLKAVDDGIVMVTEDYLEASEAAGKEVKLTAKYLANVGGAKKAPAKKAPAKAPAKKAPAKAPAKKAPAKKAPAKKAPAKKAPAKKAPVEPLEGTVWAITGTLSETRAKIAARLEDLGAVVAKSFTKAVTHCLSGEDDVKKNSAKCRKAKDQDVPIIKETFLEACEAKNSFVSLTKKFLHAGSPAPSAVGGGGGGGGGGDSDDDMSESEDESESESESEEEAVITKQIQKGAAPLDPFLPKLVADKVHVYAAGGVIWDVMLNQTNVDSNNNKFYVIQLLESDGASREYYSFTRWGRVGVPGSQALLGPTDLANAKRAFSKKFSDKSNNYWPIKAEDFVKYDRKYQLVPREYATEEDDATTKAKMVKSKLHALVQDVIKTIFSVDNMNSSLMEIGYDSKRMPLGKLSDEAIRQGYEILAEIDTVINGKRSGSSKVLNELSSRFFSLIPHDIGFSNTASLKIVTAEKLKEKMKMLEQLKDMAITARILKSAKSVKRNPIDVHYESLKAQLKPVPKSSKTFKMVAEYARIGHAPTHTRYTVDVLNVLEVFRNGEVDRFRKVAKDIGNVNLMWHGSRQTNYVGIISQGLRIAPPEAPVTGYMFGKGVYFADLMTKAAQYCYPSPSNNKGYMMLCEVALGKSQTRLRSDYYASTLSPGCSSTWGQGGTKPDESTHFSHDGAHVPFGKPVPSKIDGSSLLYNEFIVYDTKQIRIKYLIEVKFTFTSSYGYW